MYITISGIILLQHNKVCRFGKLMLDDILLNNEGKSCDKGSSSTMVPQHGDSKCTQNKEDASALGVTKMEVGSPEKNATNLSIIFSLKFIIIG